jgi:DNA-binding CsgD family transcriptional regulator
MEKRANRSDHYQQIFHESLYSNEMLESFSNEDSIYGRLNPFDYNEDILMLEDELKKEFWRIVNTLLTKRQRQVIRLYAEGKTQMEIAKILQVNQSSITKSLNGNVDYKNGTRSVYGGSKKKLLKLIEEDPKISEILKKIRDLKDDKW